MESALTRRRVLSAAAGATLLGLAGCGGAEQPRPTPTRLPRSSSPIARIGGYEDPSRWSGRSLRVGAWGGQIQTALRDRVLNPFALATGCAVQMLSASYGDLATSITGGQAYLDVLIGDAFWARSAVGGGVAQGVPDGVVAPERFGPMSPSAGVVPAYTYALVAAFRRDAVAAEEPLSSWAAWGDGAAHPGARALPARAFGSLEISLLADGVEPDMLYPLDIDRALAGLQRLAPDVGDRWWTSGDQPTLWLSRQRADFAAAWHYRVVDALRDGRPVDFIWDDGLLIADYWAIAAASANADVAADFIGYATAPEIQASLASAVPLGPVAPAAFGFLDGREARYLPTSPDRASRLVPVDAGWWVANGREANTRFDAWLAQVQSDAS